MVVIQWLGTEQFHCIERVLYKKEPTTNYLCITNLTNYLLITIIVFLQYILLMLYRNDAVLGKLDISSLARVCMMLSGLDDHYYSGTSVLRTRWDQAFCPL